MRSRLLDSRWLFSCLILGAAVPAQEPAPERTIYGGLDDVLIQSALPDEVRLVESLTTPRGGAGEVSGFCTDPLCTIQTIYLDPVQGNGVLLVWKENALNASGVRVLADGREVCRVPGLTADKIPGYNVCVATGLAMSCLPESENDPNCPSVQECNLPFRAVNVRTFEVIGSAGSLGEACQEVIGGPPMAGGGEFCCRTVESSTACASILAKFFDCDALADYPDGEIIITGGSNGPPSTFFEIQIDDDGVLRRIRLEQGVNVDNIVCWERSLGVTTKGSHEVNVYGFVNREDAENLFWTNPQTGDGYGGLVGTYLLSVQHTVTTTAGKPKAPRELLVRQTAYGAGTAGAVLATWRFAEVAYSKVNVYLDNLTGSPKQVLAGSQQSLALGSLSQAKHTFGVQGDDGAAGGKSSITQASITLLAASPHTRPVNGSLNCSFSASNGGTTTASWTPADPSDLIDVYLAGNPPVYQKTIPGNSTSVSVQGTTAGDSLSLQFLKAVNGQYYGSPLVNCSSGGAKRFIRGWCNGRDDTTPQIDISSAIFGLSFLFTGGPAPACRESCDANNDGGFDISDMVFLLSFLFSGGNPPAGWIDSNADGRKDPTCETAQAGADCQISHGPCR